MAVDGINSYDRDYRHVRAMAIEVVGQYVHTHPLAAQALVEVHAHDPSPAVRKKAGWYAPGGPIYRRTVRGPHGSPRAVHLFTAHSLSIQRHTKIKGEANPYDPQWEPYFEKRLARKMAASLKGRKTLLALWKRQDGRCPHCGEAITTLTGWHSHHKVWRSHGGSDAADNRVLLHPTCHRQIHHPQGSTRMPPPVTRGFGKA